MDGTFLPVILGQALHLDCWPTGWMDVQGSERAARAVAGTGVEPYPRARLGPRAPSHMSPSQTDTQTFPCLTLQLICLQNWIS